MGLIYNNKQAYKVISDLCHLYYEGTGIFGKHSAQYEDIMQPVSMKKGSNDHVVWITLLSSLDYIRDADVLWGAGKIAAENNATKWIFDVKRVNNVDLASLTRALLSSKIAQRKDKDTDIWKRVSVGIVEIMNGDILDFIKSRCEGDARILYYYVGLKYKKTFPVLSGPKILSMWIRLLQRYANVKLSNINEIPIPVDVHVARATINIACQSKSCVSDIEKERQGINDLWDSIAKELKDYNKHDFDECLMTLSRIGCTNCKYPAFKMKGQCPVKAYCRALNERISVSQGSKGIIINKEE